MRARFPPLVLAVVGLVLSIGFASAWLGGTSLRVMPLVAPIDSPWWAYLFLTLLAVAMLALAGAVAIDPRPLVLRQALAGAALVWLVILGGAVLYALYAGRLGIDTWQGLALIAADAFGLIALAATTVHGDQDQPTALGRLGAAITFAAATHSTCDTVTPFTTAGRTSVR